MRLCSVVLLVGFAVVAAPATGDEVDDLLAGKAGASGTKSSAELHWSALSNENALVPPLDVMPLPAKAPWEGAVADPAEPSVVPEAAPRDETPPSRVNLVPEPSAILLAVLALVYFLVFFRRRHFA
jgi:hypothetical protein